MELVAPGRCLLPGSIGHTEVLEVLGCAGLTVLGDEGNAGVHDDGDVPPAQLLVPQGIAPAPC